jgi:hypothetical protein
MIARGNIIFMVVFAANTLTFVDNKNAKISAPANITIFG